MCGASLAVARRLIGVCIPAKLAALTVQQGRYLIHWSERSRRCSVGQHWGGWGIGVMGYIGGLAC